MIQIKDKTFIPFLEEKTLQKKIAEIGLKISKDFAEKDPIIIGVLNGAFMFLSDLARQISIPAEITFIKISSYSGEKSTGKVKSLIGLETKLEGRNVIVVEDIVDTGLSMSQLIQQLKENNPASISLATLLYKPEAIQYKLHLDYIGFEIPNKFVVGYGLDYDGFGRNLREIYQLKQ
ncbi:hypoxanthine phosphoribosyltransferase [Shivajiella indica]|uniref:Hypoxanthine phosphoribosyltransferase n=1 Tax=Shivajiella indica TaxID=872115 RepID=A0ABW5B938_9BACT